MIPKYPKYMLLLLLVVMVACQKKPVQRETGNHYATGFSIQNEQDYTLVEVYDPWSKGIMQRYYLVHNQSVKTPSDGMKLRIPLQRIATTSCTHIGFLNALNQLQTVCGVCNPELIYTPLQGGATFLSRQEVANLGDAMQINIERVLLAHPDALMLSTYAQGDNQRTALEQAGIPIIFNNEWTESHPLARAEWIRFVAAFYDMQAEADSIFKQIEADYQALTALQNEYKDEPKRSILSGGNFRGTWYLPSGKGYMGQLFADAGADYFYQNDNTEGSLPLTFETVLLNFQQADVWVGASTRNLQELKDLDEKHTWFKAYKTGEVYNFLHQTNASANNFWEEGVVHPEYILQDLIFALYPSRLNNYHPHYIEKLQ